MTKKLVSQFQSGQSTKKCYNCKKLTRDTGRGEKHTDYCWTCLNGFELENEHSDDGHDEFNPDCPTCQDEVKSHLYIIDSNERGQFSAHVENELTGKIVFEFADEDGTLWIVEDGFIKNIEDVDGLLKYLITLEVLKESDTLKLSGGIR